jgi:hypothetical protein
MNVIRQMPMKTFTLARELRRCVLLIAEIYAVEDK